MRVGKIISVENGPKRDVEVRITRDRLFSEISVPPGEISGAEVSGIRVVEEEVGGNKFLHLYLETLAGTRVLFYTGATKFDIALLLDELEASLGNKPTRAWVKAEPKDLASVSPHY
jgi:hypothetical protein